MATKKAIQAKPAPGSKIPKRPTKPSAARDTKRDVVLARRISGRDAAREAALVRRTLAAMAAIPDDRPGLDVEVMKAIDEGRPHRPLFRGYY